MLRRLSVENYALIDKLDLQPDAALNIITGETGAGKSILLGALGLLLGNKNDSGAIHDQERSCVIEAEFDIAGYSLEEFFSDNDLDYEPLTVVRRVISPSGKSRAFVNDIPVQLAVLKDLGAALIDIHSQHRNMLLSDEKFRTEAVDTLADTTQLGLTKEGQRFAGWCTTADGEGVVWEPGMMPETLSPDKAAALRELRGGLL
jgi:DNA repair protein RecN (Recombination protein N)